MNFLSMLDTTQAGIMELIQLTKKVKTNPDKYSQLLSTKTLTMLFEKPSTRTKVSFEVAMNKLGGHAINLDFAQIRASKKETIADTALTLSSYSDCIMARLCHQQDLISLQKFSQVPIINGQTEQEHPCQALSDIFTMDENRKIGETKTFCYIGNAKKNITNSLIVACAKTKTKVMIACPKQYSPSKKYLDEAQKYTNVQIETDVKKAVCNADVIYTDRWFDVANKRNVKNSQIKDYQVNMDVLKLADKNCIIMHPLPANRNVEISSECLDCNQSVVWQQSKNRLHVQKALLLKVLEVVEKA